MKRIDISRQGKQWVAKSGNDVVAKAANKVGAVHKTAQQAKKMPEAVTVKIHKLNGEIQEERTYPKSADPHKSKG
jgi:hypothetical protein